MSIVYLVVVLYLSGALIARIVIDICRYPNINFCWLSWFAVCYLFIKSYRGIKDKKIIYTTIDQSKRLLSLGIDKITADYYCTILEQGFSVIKPIEKDFEFDGDDIPIWSLSRLIRLVDSNEAFVITKDILDSGNIPDKIFNELVKAYNQKLVILYKWIPVTDENYWLEYTDGFNDGKYYTIVSNGVNFYTSRDCPYGWSTIVKGNYYLMNLKLPE